MKKLTILVDMDSILVHLDEKWYRTYNERHGDDLTIDKVLTWDTHLYCKNENKAIYDVLNDPGFFRDLPAIPGGLESVKQLQDMGHEIIIVTASPDSAMGDKKAWIKQHMPWLPRKHVFMGDLKYKINGDVLIDDGPHNIIEYRKHHPNAFIATIDYPFNRSAHHLCDLVAHGYKDYLGAWEQILNGVTQYAESSK